MKKKHLCYKCPYLGKAYSEELRKYVFACNYESRVTAWACVEDEKDGALDGEIYTK